LAVGQQDRVADGVEVGHLVLLVPDSFDFGQGLVVAGRRAGDNGTGDVDGPQSGNDDNQQQHSQQDEDDDQDGADKATAERRPGGGGVGK